MADWFKLYENDLDDERLQWAMSEQQQVAIIYVGILSRCCRDKSGTLPWKGMDFELFALAQKVHVSAPVANQCLGLLEKIEFIKIENNQLKVLRWNDRQSEYCQKKSAVIPTVSRHTPDNVPTVSAERRGEERRSTPPIVPQIVLIPENPIPNRVCDLRADLNAMYVRDAVTRWGYEEERLLVEVAKRQNCFSELSILRDFRPKRGKYFPQSIESLLTNWQKTLDAARNGHSTQESPVVTMKAIEEEISIHPANKQSDCHNPNCTQAQKDHLKHLREKHSTIRSQIANA